MDVIVFKPLGLLVHRCPHKQQDKCTKGSSAILTTHDL